MTTRTTQLQQYAMELLSTGQASRQASIRVIKLQKDIFLNMKETKVFWEDVGSILDETTVKEPLIIRNAMALKRKLEIAPIGIWDDQLFAGCYAFKNENIILTGKLPGYATAKEIADAAKKNVTTESIVGHIVPDYFKLLKYGVAGIIETTREKLLKCRKKTKRDFYQAVILALEGLADFARRHADYCRSLAARTEDLVRKKELLLISENLRYSPLHPPQTFHQAVGAVWITHLAFQITGNRLAMGRADQYLEPFLAIDLEENRIDLDTAQEYVDCFFLKFNERTLDNTIEGQKLDLKAVRKKQEEGWSGRSLEKQSFHRDNIRDRVDATNHWLQNVIIGGIKPEDGSDATNLLTLMCLEAFRRNRMTNPVFTVRLHARSPQYLVDLTSDVLITGGGSPAVFNDEAIVSSLIASGFPVEDARDYTNDGCWEVIVPGRTDFAFHRFIIIKCLEWVLNGGRSYLDNKQEAPEFCDLADLKSFDDVMACFQRYLVYEIEYIMKLFSKEIKDRSKIAPVPLLSALLEGPVEKGLDMTECGAKYLIRGVIASGFSHLIDSFSAMKKVVFENKEATLCEMAEALRNNYLGYENLRKLVLDAPKYGNNDPYADLIGHEIIDMFAANVKELNKRYDKIKFLPGVGTFSWYIAVGEGVGATPDGRLSAQPVSSNFSPSIGAAKKGITGALLSFTKMSIDELTQGSPIDLRVNRKLISGTGGNKRISGILQSFVELKGNMMTLTVEDTETLRKAQLEPENYPDLRVRMGGWSAYFTMLSKEQQEHHISKQDKL